MNKYYAILLASSVIFFSSCNDETEPIQDTRTEQALNNYADIVLASYEDSYSSALALDTQIKSLVENPSAENFQAAKDAWKVARIYYGQTEAYRFYGGPIDDAQGPEGYINAWPMDEIFIDYVETDPESGLINDAVTYPVISKDVLKDLNESISETSIFTGYHAIEFLLWGQDFSADSPGNRAYTDYVKGENGTATNQERRGEYLIAVSELLLDDLNYLVDAWKEGANYRNQFLNVTPTNQALGKVFTALGELSKGELAGERMFVAVDTQDQENEHSCFSDNTDVDIKMNFQGIFNVYYGKYTRLSGETVSGQSFAELAREASPEKAKAADDAFADVATKIAAIPTPFDQAIVNSPEVILAAVDALSDLSDKIADVALELNAEY